MALFKILKGQEKNLPANKTEGWAYVTTDEGNMYVDVSASKRVKIGAHADKADVATKAEGDTKSIREIYLAKLKQVTSNGTTFTFRGYAGDGSEKADLITVPNASTSVAGLITNSDQSIKGTKTLDDGMLIIKPVGRSSWNEGIRILAANNGWTTLAMGGSETSGTNASIWSMHTYQSNFYIAHSGSNSSTTGIFQSDANGNWRIDNSLGIGGKNAAYTLYVNGKSYFNSTGNSTYSKDGNASILTTGGVSVAGRVSANSIKIDNADSGANTEGCIMKYNSTSKCIEFIFGI